MGRDNGVIVNYNLKYKIGIHVFFGGLPSVIKHGKGQALNLMDVSFAWKVIYTGDFVGICMGEHGIYIISLMF